jgi:hypothetical protein
MQAVTFRHAAATRDIAKRQEPKVEMNGQATSATPIGGYRAVLGASPLETKRNVT